MSRLIRLVCPDSHGSYIDPQAAKAAIEIARKVKPTEIVFLGDQLDASGLFSAFKRAYLSDRYSFKDDVDKASSFIADLVTAAGKPSVYALEGNHEHHIERWIAGTASSDTADFLGDKLDPYRILGFDKFCPAKSYVKRGDTCKGMTVRGVLKLEGCYFMHGAYQSLHATYRHATAFGANICHGHTHRATTTVLRRPTGEVYGGYCPGTLAQFAPLYQQTTPESWTHGVGLQFVERGHLTHFNVPIHEGRYVLV